MRCEVFVHVESIGVDIKLVAEWIEKRSKSLSRKKAREEGNNTYFPIARTSYGSCFINWLD